jgi:hypothetical protein
LDQKLFSQSIFWKKKFDSAFTPHGSNVLEVVEWELGYNCFDLIKIAVEKRLQQGWRRKMSKINLFTIVGMFTVTVSVSLYLKINFLLYYIF